ncbi:MAG: carboxypeptidase-like regulatory domain-containing protein [Bacteroidales bacterium]|nr:carboxypeptidase-like regulatory domain-containing protein [Bacteroidales bacterium]
MTDQTYINRNAGRTCKDSPTEAKPQPNGGMKRYLFLMLVFFVSLLNGQNEIDTLQTISGIITDEQGIPIPFASVFIEDTTLISRQRLQCYCSEIERNRVFIVGNERNPKTITHTDWDGNFSLNVPKNSVIEIAFVGFERQRIPIKNLQKINVTLESNMIALDEIVHFGPKKPSELLDCSNYDFLKKLGASFVEVTSGIDTIKPFQITNK